MPTKSPFWPPMFHISSFRPLLKCRQAHSAQGRPEFCCAVQGELPLVVVLPGPEAGRGLVQKALIPKSRRLHGVGPVVLCLYQALPVQDCDMGLFKTLKCTTPPSNTRPYC